MEVPQTADEVMLTQQKKPPCNYQFKS